MGVVDEITAGTYPRQSPDIGRAVRVVFHHDLSRQIPGIIVRDDVEAPHKAIIALSDGRFVLTTECQYTFAQSTRAHG